MRGVRLGFAGQLTHRWKVAGGYTYLRADIIKGIAVNTAGKVPVNTPTHTVDVLDHL